MIILKDIKKTYFHQGKTIAALDNINLQVSKAEIFGIIGRSGAGKSTLIRCINLLERPDQGSVIIDQQELTQLNTSDLRQARKQIGMIFQHFNLLSNRHAYDNIALPLKLAGQSNKEIKQAVDPLLELVGLKDKVHHYPSQLSGGQKQRVAVARALVTRPKVLLCDEATSALDPETTLSILELLKTINEKYQISIVLITHEMGAIKEIADQVAVIDQGKIIEKNAAVDLFTRPQQPISKNFVNSVLAHQLPHSLNQKISQQKSDNNVMIARLLFHKQASDNPVITELVKKFNLTINIIQGSIEMVGNESIGVLFIEVLGEPSGLDQAKQYLYQNNIDFEVIGYVA